MYCPNCGSENNKNQNFCRYCGFNLTDAAKSLKLQRAFGERAHRLKKSGRVRRSINRISEVLLIGFFFAAVCVFLLDAGKLSAFLKVSIGIFFVFQTVVRIIDYLQREETKKSFGAETAFESDQDNRPESKETRKFLEDKPFESVPSAAAENSTELLFAENKTRKFE